VIVNISRWRCDALIVEDTGVTSVPLPLTADESFNQVNRYLVALQQHTEPDEIPLQERKTAEVLEWMWDSITQPVLDGLNIFEAAPGQLQRIWWCPTGPLTLLPIHAAGYHALRDGRTVFDRVVSSYTPTLRALAKARNQVMPEGASKMLIVAVSKTSPNSAESESEHATLRGAAAERRLLESHLGKDACTTLSDERATHEAIMAGIREHQWAHIACHGTQDLQQPSNGGLVPFDWRTSGLVSIRDLTEAASRGGRLAFLSACQTATGGTTNLDEAVNIAAAMQYSGWQHVIGTLWNVYDGAATVVAAHLYSHLLQTGKLDATNSARALHDAVGVLRDENPSSTAHWARFIHTGP
jgi:CHAT domain-containing protein